jgi:hypothetical protein
MSAMLSNMEQRLTKNIGNQDTINSLPNLSEGANSNINPRTTLSAAANKYRPH